MKSCDAYRRPVFDRHLGTVCGECNVAAAEHGPFGTEQSLYEMAAQVANRLGSPASDPAARLAVLTSLLPELTRAMAREYGR